MLQNHILQVLALIAMSPVKMNARELRREKTKLLSATRLSTDVILGQYESYKSEDGVDPRVTLLPILLALYSSITGVGREHFSCHDR